MDNREAERAQKAAENGRQKELYNIVEQLTGKGNKQTAAVKRKDGELLKSKDARLTRWKEHFEEVLNREIPESTPQEEQEQREELDISVEPPPTHEERALMALRNGKVPRADQITAEMLKSDLVQTSQELKFTFAQILKEERMPKEWTKGLICKIPKKGNLKECGNWR